MSKRYQAIDLGRLWCELILTTLVVTSLSSCGGLGGDSDAGCVPCESLSILTIQFGYIPSDKITFIVDGRTDTTNAIYDQGRDAYIRSFYVWGDQPSYDLQVIEDGETKLDTTVSPDYDATYDECMDDINPECLRDTLTVYVES